MKNIILFLALIFSTFTLDAQKYIQTFTKADVGCDMPNYHAFMFREFSPAERRALIKGMIAENPRIGLLVIDGLLDLVRNFNDEKEAAEVLQFLMTLSDMGIMVLTVIHTGEGKDNQSKPLGHLGSTVMRKADFILNCSIENKEESEDNVKLRRIRVRQTISRGESIKSFSAMSYQKMLYITGKDVPDHYRKWWAKETGMEDLTPLALPKGITPEMKAMQEMMGATTVKIERTYPDDWDMPPTGRAAAIPQEKDDEIDAEFMALLGVGVEELRNTS